jgi:hypothetical protein
MSTQVRVTSAGLSEGVDFNMMNVRKRMRGALSVRIHLPRQAFLNVVI